mmetsp:Transcript_50962/g.100167  ORF Transcript_50962/g.100167 Transcript_50962/m.100167 type:complete len:231 (-) Transcript_50962:121-813(-)
MQRPVSIVRSLGSSLGCSSSPATSPGVLSPATSNRTPTSNAPASQPSRGFATRIFQKRRYQMRIVQNLQTDYMPKPPGYRPIPLSVLQSRPLKKLVESKSAEAKELAARVDWEKYKCDVRGVRWHPSGAWHVQFQRDVDEKIFHVRCNALFKVSLYGFEGAKQQAIAYRKRLEAEWEELQERWAEMDREDAEKRKTKRETRERWLRGEGDEDFAVGEGNYESHLEASVSS